MPNPYESPTTLNAKPFPRRWTWPILITFSAFAVVILNYATSSDSQFRTGGIRDNLFTHVVFLLFPLSACLQLSGESLYRHRIAVGTLSAFMLLAFILEFSPILFDNGNPYEAFTASNKLFGGYDWCRWLWLVGCSIAPLSLLARTVGTYGPLRWAVVGLSLLGHVNNAWLVWRLCHISFDSP
jgi:hypothetical protein